MQNQRVLFKTEKNIFGMGSQQGVYDLFGVCALAAIYYVFAVWGLHTSFQNTNASPIWPSSGIAFTALFIFGYRLWPGIWLGAFLANLTIFAANPTMTLSSALFTAVLIGIGNTLESLLGVFLLNSFVAPRNPLFKVGDIFRFVFVVLIAALASATTGVTAVSLAQHLPWPVFKVAWSTWWLGDVLSILILMPFFLVVYGSSRKLWPFNKILEAAFLCVILVGIDLSIFGTNSFLNQHHFPTIYLILPFIVWATFRFNYWGTTITALVTLFFGFYGTTHILGPFVSPELNFSLLLLQTFIAIVTITGLVLAAALHEREEHEEALRHFKESLEALVEKRSRELWNTQKELKQASRLADIGTLAATVAHELRNPLGVIQMAAYNLKRKTLGEDKHLINIEKKVWEGNRIIDNLLSYSRIKVPSYEPIALFNILDECVASVLSRFPDYRVIVEKKYERAGVERMEADPHQLKEIFVNILNNACQAFSQKNGKIELMVRIEEENCVSVVFKDNGTGIEEDDLNKIFTPFFTRKSKGTGLGLSICNEMVNMHKGKIEVSSVKGEGTSIKVVLPIKPAKARAQGEQA